MYSRFLVRLFILVKLQSDKMKSQIWNSCGQNKTFCALHMQKNTTVSVIHKKFLLLNRHNGDDAPEKNQVASYSAKCFDFNKEYY